MVERAKKKKVKREEVPQIVDLLDMGVSQPQSQPQAQAKAESEESEEEVAEKGAGASKEESKEEKGGFKKLSAPPTSKLHLLENMRNLKNKLQQ